MKYPLHDELKSLNDNKMPAKPEVIPMINEVMKLSKCETDEFVNVKEIKIAGYRAEPITTYIIEPKDKKVDIPCLVFFHGGGFMLKASAAHYELAKEYAAKTPCVVVYADYRLAPEYQFPVPVEDCYAAYKWTLEHTRELSVDRNCIIVGGDSAGGNLAAAVTLMARDRGLQLPRYEMLIYPVTDRRMITQSMIDYIDTPVWDSIWSKMMWECYLGEQEPEKIEYASPVEASSFENFPPTYFEVAEFDCLRDEGILLYNKLKEVGVEVEIHEIKNACHGYETAIESSITRNAMARRIKRLQELIN